MFRRIVLPITAAILLFGALTLPVQAGPGSCINGAYCDDSICYTPDSNVSKLFCQCQRLDPACGLGQCIGASYCDSGLCGDGQCYAADSFLSLALCSGIPLDGTCRLTSVEGCTAPPPEMHVWWNFDEANGPTAFDTRGNNHGSHVNGPLPWPGQVANGLLFDGIDDHVSAPRVGPHSYHNLTLDAWIRLDDTSPDTYYPIVHYGRLQQQITSEYDLMVKGDELFFVTQVDPMSFAVPSSGANLQPHVWTHVAVTADAARGLIRFFVNGALVTTYSTYVAYGSHSIVDQGWTVGYHPADLYFDGMIDEVEIFERPLGTWEIRALYEAGPAGKCKGN